jgi:hypothetical protein
MPLHNPLPSPSRQPSPLLPSLSIAVAVIAVALPSHHPMLLPSRCCPAFHCHCNCTNHCCHCPLHCSCTFHHRFHHVDHCPCCRCCRHCVFHLRRHCCRHIVITASIAIAVAMQSCCPLPLMLVDCCLICFPASLLSLSENVRARIASGTNDHGHRSRYAIVHLVRLSAHQFFPDMLRKTFGQ